MAAVRRPRRHRDPRAPGAPQGDGVARVAADRRRRALHLAGRRAGAQVILTYWAVEAAGLAAEAVAAYTAARAIQYDIDNRRYRAESTMNQWVGFLYEVRVKTSTATSDSHLKRSESFFIAMLLFIVSGVAHMRIGMQVIIEDYVHEEGAKVIALGLNTFFSAIIAVVCLFAVLKLSFGG